MCACTHARTHARTFTNTVPTGCGAGCLRGREKLPNDESFTGTISMTLNRCPSIARPQVCVWRRWAFEISMKLWKRLNPLLWF